MNLAVKNQSAAGPAHFGPAPFYCGSSTTVSRTAAGPAPSGKSDALRAAITWRRLELLLFAAVLLAFNWQLARGVFSQNLTFLPSAVAAGEWWRLLTHPFVHVSWYHLLLDGVAFLLLYDTLEEGRGLIRALYVIASAAGSLLAAWGWDPMIGTHGLCGLSGIAHGLMAVTALEMMSPGGTQKARIAGLMSYGLVIGKCAFEALTGQALIGFLHFGLLGTPVAVCHAGGVLGGITVFALVSIICSHSPNPRIKGRSPLSRCSHGRNVTAANLPSAGDSVLFQAQGCNGST